MCLAVDKERHDDGDDQAHDDGDDHAHVERHVVGAGRRWGEGQKGREGSVRISQSSHTL